MPTTNKTDSDTILNDKKAFFDGLYTLDDDVDEQLQQEATVVPRKERQQAQNHQLATQIPSMGDVHANIPPILPRSISDPHIVNGGTKSRTSSRPRSAYQAIPTPIAIPNGVASTKKRTTNAAPCNSSVLSKTLGKRKREVAVKLVPEAQQIFKGLHFYFFPNSDTHPARRMRITKALEFGATWQQEWVDEITHVILDKIMPYGTLLQFLKKDHLDHVAAVNEIWPSECIAYRAVLNTDAEQFRPIGFPAHVNETDSQEASRSSSKSPQLKPANAAVQIKGAETQRTNSNNTTKMIAMNDAEIRRLPQPAMELQNHAVTSTGELDAVIEEARALQQLPLEDYDETPRPNTSDSISREASDIEETSSSSKPKRLAYQDKFQCMQAHGGERANNPNTDTIVILEQMADYYTKIGDQWRPRAYRKAIATLRKQPRHIATRAEAVTLPFIGERLAVKIEEIAFTDRLRRLDNARAEPRDQVMQTFMAVYGAGYNQASRWVNQGFTTLDELMEKADLNENQRIGIEHYSDFNSRIPRSEVAEHGEIVREALNNIDKELKLIVGGSYRRGAETSGDIDCIITHPTHSASALLRILLDRLIPTLFRQGFLKASLASSNPSDGHEGSKWHGASCLPSSQIWRRMDLLLVPPDELGAGLIYFTGNDIFNRSLRLLASHKGMRLNQRGLYTDVMRGKARLKITEGTLIEGRDERKIFEILGVPWREPNERVC